MNYYKNGTFDFQYILTEEMKTIYNEFIEKCERTTDNTAIGGRYSLIITPTSLGTSIVIRDSLTNQIVDLTDYNSW